MAHQKRTTVVGVFTDRREADRAIDALYAAGFRNDQIGVISPNSQDERVGEGDESHSGAGALTGVLAGAGLGALAGLGILAGVIPAIGPAIAGGTLGILFSNAAAGAGILGVTGALIGAGVPEDEVEGYEDEFKSGRTIVTVKAEERASEATQILRVHGAVDLSARAGTHQMTNESDLRTASGMTQGQTIELREEQLIAQTRPVETGEVRVRKDVVTERQTIDVPVEREEVVIERRPVSGKASSGDISSETDEIRIPVREEQVVVDKQNVVREEVAVGKRTVRDTERVEGEVRKEQIHVEREGDTGPATRG